MKKLLSLLCVVSVIVLTFSFSFSASAATVTKVSVADLISDGPDYWQGLGIGAENLIFDGPTLQMLPADIKNVSNKTKKFKDVELDFDMTVNWPTDATDWGCIFTLRDTDGTNAIWVEGRGDTYVVTISQPTTGAFTLDVARYLPISKPNQKIQGFSQKPLPSNFNNKKCHWNVTCQDVATGVNIIVKVDGVEYANIIDTSADKIQKEGFVMFTNHAARSVIVTGTTSPGYKKPVVSSVEPSSIVPSSVATSSIDSSSEEVSSDDESSEISSESDTSESSNESDTSESTNNIPIILGIIIAVVIIGGIITFIIIRNKKIKS
jgi:hypothetical protein